MRTSVAQGRAGRQGEAVGRAVSIDGVITRPEDAKVSVYDRGFLYGDGVFETLRTYGGVPFAIEEHMRRLDASARAVGIELPVPARTLEAEVLEAVRAAGNAESSARIMVTRGQGPLGLDPALATSPLRVILVEPITPLPAALYRDGVSVVTVRTDRAADAAPGAKVSNYLASMLALQRARAAGAHEALILDAEGHALEGTTSNFFLVTGGALLTAPVGQILAGITRAHVIAVAEDEGIPVRYGAICKSDIRGAQEAFLTSSLREILPVVRVDGDVIGDGAPGPVTRRLHAAFRRKAGVEDIRP
jgi:branched-chain amino acid aminotransferase